MPRPKIQIDGVVREMTEDEFLQWTETLAEQQKTAYVNLRVSEYPPMSDYLDGIVKGDQAQVQAYIDACLAVKAKYPKPSQA
jgi:hypothetical protein